jgi:hypothetical protein
MNQEHPLPNELETVFIFYRSNPNSDNLLYWNRDSQQWTEDFAGATLEDESILSGETLPPWGEGVMQLDLRGNMIGIYEPELQLLLNLS